MDDSLERFGRVVYNAYCNYSDRATTGRWEAENEDVKKMCCEIAKEVLIAENTLFFEHLEAKAAKMAKGDSSNRMLINDIAVALATRTEIYLRVKIQQLCNKGKIKKMPAENDQSLIIFHRMFKKRGFQYHQDTTKHRRIIKGIEDIAKFRNAAAHGRSTDLSHGDIIRHIKFVKDLISVRVQAHSVAETLETVKVRVDPPNKSIPKFSITEEDADEDQD
ncbi:MAG: hypothetical protein F4X51_05745 [Gemmatimonadetes bacterium]|nr:hypothetical protein [Gemmatimonadota bacterium]